MNATLRIGALTADAFAAFGTVIDTRGGEGTEINEGNTIKFPDLIPHDCAHDGGRVTVHLYRSLGRSLPTTINALERHPLGSQAFWPLHQEPFLVIVAPKGDQPRQSDIRAFVTNGHQAIQYHRGTWHHYQISLGKDCDYLVIDREGPGENCEVATLSRPLLIESL